MKSVLLVLILIHWNTLIAFGQSWDNTQESIKDNMLSLEQLIESALNNSPELKSQNELINIKSSEYKIQKKNWAEYVSGFGSVSYGAGNIMTGVETAGTNFYQLTNNQNFLYNVGLQLRIPLKHAVTSKHLIKIRTNEINRAVYQRGEIEQEITIRVIELYNNILLEEQLLHIRSQAVQSSNTAFAVTEKYFMEGNTSAADLDRIFSMKVRSEEGFAKSKIELTKHFFTLREIVGVPILKR